MKTFTDEEGNKYEYVGKEYAEPGIVIKPVKKTERKYTYFITFFNDAVAGEYLLKLDLELTPTTANKLSEAISALVEFATEEQKPGYPKEEEHFELMRKIDAAYQSFQESQ